MGSSEVMRNLELLSMQYQAQREWAEQAILSAMDGVAHFSALADSFKCYCQAAMQARESALSFANAVTIFGEVLEACERTIAECERELCACHH
jgi:hypothetical protein